MPAQEEWYKCVGNLDIVYSVFEMCGHDNHIMDMLCLDTTSKILVVVKFLDLITGG